MHQFRRRVPWNQGFELLLSLPCASRSALRRGSAHRCPLACAGTDRGVEHTGHRREGRTHSSRTVFADDTRSGRTPLVLPRAGVAVVDTWNQGRPSRRLMLEGRPAAVSDRDDALRRQLGWTGPEETDYEPSPIDPTFTPAATPLPTRPPVDFVPSSDQRESSDDPRDPQAERPAGGAHQHRPRHAPPPHESQRREGPPPEPQPHDTGQFPAVSHPESPQQWGQQPGWPQHQHQGPPPPPPPPHQPSGPPRVHNPGPPTAPWPAPNFGPDTRGMPPPPPGSYADRIRADDLVPASSRSPARGWRLAVFQRHVRVGQPRPVTRGDPRGRATRPESAVSCAATTRSA